MSMPLEGVKILELTEWAFGPGCCQFLGDLGADVIKVEDPLIGDYSRAVPTLDLTAAPPPINYHFEYHNRNKKSVAIDLKTERGRELLHKLATKSDVFVTSLRPRAIRKLGVDYPSIARVNPRIIYAQASAYGPQGPDAESPGYDHLAFARSGISATLGEEGTPPVPLLHFLIDHVAALHLAFVIVVALRHRDLTGEGQEVCTSLLGTCTLMAAGMIQHVLSTGQNYPRKSRKGPGAALANIYQCQDGRWLYFFMIQSDRYWADWCAALGLEGLIQDPRFDSHQKRIDNSVELIALFDKTFATRTREEWMKRLKQKPELIWQPISTFAEAAADPQMSANDYITDVVHPAIGPMKMVGIPFHFSKTPGRIRSLGPELGQHTEDVLMEVLGLSWDEVAQLKEQRAIL